MSVAVAQQPSLSCRFYFHNSNQEYECYLSIYNPNGLNNFTEIDGAYLEGFTNADVTLLVGSAYSTNVPEIICNTFPNLVSFELHFGEITEIDDTSFSKCSQLTKLWLSQQRISSIVPNAFVNLRDIKTINLDDNLLTTLPENVFSNQQSLTDLRLGWNLFEDIPLGLFRPLENLQYLDLNRCNLNASINQLFEKNARLKSLDLSQNRIALSENSFTGLDELEYLYLGYNDIKEIPPRTFAATPNLRSLYLYGNSFTKLSADAFPNLGRLTLLHLSSNGLETIHENAFRGLENMSNLIIYSNNLRQLEQGVFVPMPNLNRIDIEYNSLKTLSRNVFGNLTNLRTLRLNYNLINALDRDFIDDALNLQDLEFSENVCASVRSGDFKYRRDENLQLFERCFFNFRHTVGNITPVPPENVTQILIEFFFATDTITEADDDSQFFEAPHPGIALSVNANSEVRIAFSTFNFMCECNMIEVLIGTANNTRSVIRENQTTNVVTVPDVITKDQWNDYRITWANENILVSRGNDSFPFMSYTIQDSFPVNFYGLRSV